MLTGPVTMPAWSFVRDDQPLADTARQVALSLRDEVGDLERAGTPVGQVDECALRETLPLRTQIHTHMCCAEFGDIVTAIDDLDADVISLEAARSHMQAARELAAHGYPVRRDQASTTSTRPASRAWTRRPPCSAPA